MTADIAKNAGRQCVNRPKFLLPVKSVFCMTVKNDGTLGEQTSHQSLKVTVNQSPRSAMVDLVGNMWICGGTGALQRIILALATY